MENYKLLKDESREHFLWRVYTYGFQTKEITQEQFGEICRRELNEPYDESAFRKLIQAFYKVWNEVKHEYMLESDDELINRLAQIEEKEDELYKQQVKTRDKIREHKTGLRNDARFDNLLDTAIECADKISRSYPFSLEVKTELPSTNKLGVLLLSDAHYGIEIDNFLNKYNKKIAEDRFEKVVLETIDFCKRNDIKDLKIINLQDLINGLIHVTTRIENEEDVITQIIEVTELLANVIYKLAPHFNSIVYEDTLDNHSRVTPNKKLSLEKENFGRLMSWYLKPRLQDVKNVTIVSERFDDTITKVDILGETCFAVHGHNDNVATVVSKLSLLTRVIPMSIFLGHTHHHYERDVMGIDIIVNGTLSGTDTYAIEHRLTSQPMQKILMYERENNNVSRTITKHINFYN